MKPSLAKNEVAALHALKSKLSERFTLVDFLLFGSKARGEGVPGSDLDVMIEIEEYSQEAISEIYDIVFEINLGNDTFISPVVFGRTEIEKGPMSESPIYKTIRREGIQV